MAKLPLLIGAALVLLAGCVQGPAANASVSMTPTLDPEGEVGAVRVLVHTPELEPVAGAQVLLQPGEASLLTGADGAVVFDALQPGDYTLVAAKPGYRAGEVRGKLVNVVAGTTTEAKLSLIKIEAVTVKYHLTSTFRGFVSCAVSAGNSAITCGRGAMVGGSPVRDPNENSIHPFIIENVQAQTAILEAKWQPSISALPSFGHLSANKEHRCAPSCTVDGAVMQGGGPSPLRVQSGHSQFAHAFSSKAEDFPKTAYLSVRAYCGAGCTASFMVQQPYDAYATIFYGEPAPPDFRFIPS